MNNQRRMAIASVATQIETLISTLEHLVHQELHYFDNLPEAFRESEKGQRAEEAAGSLEEAKGDLENALDNLNDSVGKESMFLTVYVQTGC